LPSKGKAKGNGWEREVADFLSNLYSESFVRVPNSGAFIGGKNSHRKTNLSEEQIRGFKGDIIPGPSFSKLNLEAKFYKDFAFHQIIVGSCKQLDDWINQLLITCDAGDINILAMKFNRKGSYIAYQSHYTDLNPGSSYTTYYNPKTSHGTWIITEFNSFWQLNSTHIKTLAK
jgi:hypothetical protein